MKEIKNIELSLRLPPEAAQRALAAATNVWESVRQSPNTLPFLAAAVFGLGLARLAGSLTLTLFTTLPPLPPVTPPPPPQNIRSTVNLSEIVNGVLYKEPTPEITQAAEDGVPVPELKHFKLLGTLEGDPAWARAVVQYLDNSEPIREYETGASISLAKLVSIGRETILIRFNNQKIRINVGESSKEVMDRLAAASQATAPAATAGGGEKVTKVLSREELNATLGNQAEIYKGAAFGPHLENGQITGYRINKVKNDHVFYKLGARAGDILKEVNGFPLNDTERMFELYKSIKTAPRVSIKVDRGGKQYEYDFVIRD